MPRSKSGGDHGCAPQLVGVRNFLHPNADFDAVLLHHMDLISLSLRQRGFSECAERSHDMQFARSTSLAFTPDVPAHLYNRMFTQLERAFAGAVGEGGGTRFAWGPCSHVADSTGRHRFAYCMHTDAQPVDDDHLVQ
jgi:hypothetical protein